MNIYMSLNSLVEYNVRAIAPSYQIPQLSYEIHNYPQLDRITNLIKYEFK